MASAQVVETSVANNSPSQDSNQMIFFNPGMLLLGSNHFLIDTYPQSPKDVTKIMHRGKNLVTILGAVQKLITSTGRKVLKHNNYESIIIIIIMLDERIHKIIRKSVNTGIE